MMVNPYSNTKLRIPKGFQSLLVNLSTEVLRNQPGNIVAFAADYFEKLLQRREQGQFHLSSELESNLNEENVQNEHHSTSLNSAATKIQAQFRGHLVRRELDKVKHEVHRDHSDNDSNQIIVSDDDENDQREKERAARSIQAQFRGYQVRKHLHQLTDDHEQQNQYDTLTIDHSNDKLQSDENSNHSRTNSEHSLTQFNDDFEYHTQIPRDLHFHQEFNEQYSNDNNNEMNNSTLDQAATRIQASYRGYKTRKQLNTIQPHSHIEHQHYDEKHNKNILSASNENNQVFLSDNDDNEAAAVKIQAAYRGYRVRKELDK